MYLMCYVYLPPEAKYRSSGARSLSHFVVKPAVTPFDPLRLSCSLAWNGLIATDNHTSMMISLPTAEKTLAWQRVRCQRCTGTLLAHRAWGPVWRDSDCRVNLAKFLISYPLRVRCVPWLVSLCLSLCLDVWDFHLSHQIQRGSTKPSDCL